jgi:tetrahydromethanopterin S-methyltransferase subunit A
MMNVLGNIFGEVCKTIFPIPEEIYLGNPNSSIAICTLSDIRLLKKIANSNLMNEIVLVGRLLSENKGIDSIIRYVNSHHSVNTIIICGQDVFGHESGHSLLTLHKNGIDLKGKIINSSSPDPILTVSQMEVTKFQNQIKIINLIGTSNFNEISKSVTSKKI